MRGKMILFTLVTLALQSCDNSVVFEEYQAVQDGWLYENELLFDINIEDASLPYNLFVNVRHTNDYAYSNLWVQLTSTRPDSTSTTAKYDLKLAESDGKWLGESWGSSITQERLVQQGIKFQKPSTYQFKLKHDMRLNQVRSITHMGLRLEKMTSK